MYRTTGAIDEKTFNEICLKTLPTGFVLAAGAFSVISVLMIIACFIEQSTENIKLYLAGLVLFWFLIISRYFTYKRKVIEKIKSTGKDEIRFTTWFEQDRIHIINESNGASSNVAYTVFSRLVESDRLLLLLTRRSQFVPVFKEGLREGELEELKSMLREKCTKIRRYR